MVKLFRYKNKKVKIKTLKSRKYDFFRINPFAIVRMGAKRLVRKGFLSKGQSRPADNPNHFITRSFITHWSPTRFNDRNIHVGFTVTIKAVSKYANKRNLIKRRLRAIVNENIRDYKVMGYDFIFTARSSILDTSFVELKQEFKRTFKFIEKQIRAERIANSENDEN